MQITKVLVLGKLFYSRLIFMRRAGDDQGRPPFRRYPFGLPGSNNLAYLLTAVSDEEKKISFVKFSTG